MAKLQQGVAAGAESTPNPDLEAATPDTNLVPGQEVIGRDFFGYGEEPVPGDTPDTGVEGDLGSGETDDLTSGASQDLPADELQKQRFEYWQSKHDQAQARIAEMEAYMPVIEFINQNPQLLQAIEQQAMSSPTPTQPAQPQVLQRPTAPGPRPAGYNDADAHTNPDSESWKYRLAKEQYTDQLLDYQSQLLEQQSRETQQRKMEAYQAAQQQAAMNRVRHEVQSKFHLTGADLEDFIQTMSDPASVSLENLHALWQLRRGKVVPQAQAQRKVEQMNQLRQNTGAPPPVGVQSGSSRPAPENLNENQQMSKAFVDFAKRKSIRL